MELNIKNLPSSPTPFYISNNSDRIKQGEDRVENLLLSNENLQEKKRKGKKTRFQIKFLNKSNSTATVKL